MTRGSLRPTAFRGDLDVADLHAFLQPERQYAGDTLWTFGASLKSAYVNTFEFLNHAPVVQLWRDAQGQIQAVLRIELGPGEWFYQAAPDCREPAVATAIAAQADAALELLSDHDSWRTVAHQSDAASAGQLEESGYVADGGAQVYMTRSLGSEIRAVPDPAGCSIRVLDPENPKQVAERGDAQLDAFLEDQPRDEVAAWIARTLPHQLSYGRPLRPPCVVAVDANGRVLAFADPYFDPANKIGEFEPVGTRKEMQRRGLAKAVVTRGLELMQRAGMQQAVVRTGVENAAAIAAYASVGFEVSDQLLYYRKKRQG